MTIHLDRVGSVAFKSVPVAVVLADAALHGDASANTVIQRGSGDVPRKFGPCYEVPEGCVWREATLDANGRDVAVWWWARRTGARVKVLRSGRTRAEAASLLKE